MVTQFAPVCPLPIARQIAATDAEAFGNYHLLIATEVLKDPIEHNRFWAKRRNDVIILDNGVIETGAALNIRLLAAAAVLVKADIVIVPDVIGDADATMEAALKLSGPLSRLLPNGTELMGVIQAKTYIEAKHCDEVFANCGIEWNAIPKGYRERNVGMRRDWTVGHVLGFSNNDWADDMAAANRSGGIDSAVPIWLAGEGLTLPKYLSTIAYDNPYANKRRPVDYWDWQELDPDQLSLAVENIRKVRSWLNEGER